MKQTLDLWPSRTVINLVNPNPADYKIEDIAWGLSWEMRFACHIPRFYSVAEHCVHAAEIGAALFEMGPLARLLACRCLLHDAPEGVGWRDLPSPIKALIPEYKRYEKIHQRAIYERFGLDRENDLLDAKVKAIDNHLYELEHSELRLGVPLAGLELQFWSPEQARENFLEAFHKLFPEHVW
jgi:hypothetical protein